MLFNNSVMAFLVKQVNHEVTSSLVITFYFSFAGGLDNDRGTAL
jgi:hypothetical protein